MMARARSSSSAEQAVFAFKRNRTVLRFAILAVILNDGARAWYVYSGCWTDYTNTKRDLPYDQTWTSSNTPRRCIEQCQALEYAFAGVENSGECHCGSGYGGQGPSGNCRSQCTGDSDAICGEGGAIGVMATSYAHAPCNVNVALGRNAYQSSTPHSDTAPGNAVDGNTDTNRSADSCAVTGNDTQAWWGVDLGQVTNVSLVKIYNGEYFGPGECNPGWQYSDGYCFYLSGPDDPPLSQNDAIRACQATPDADIAIFDNAEEFDFFKTLNSGPAPAQNVNNTNISYTNVFWFGRLKITDTLVNGGGLWVDWNPSPYSPPWDSYYPRALTYCVAITNDGMRDENCSQPLGYLCRMTAGMRLQNFVVKTTNLAVALGSGITSSLCAAYPDVASDAAVLTFVCLPSTAPGRYLYIQLLGTGFLQLCEVEVYAAAPNELADATTANPSSAANGGSGATAACPTGLLAIGDGNAPDCEGGVMQPSL